MWAAWEYTTTIRSDNAQGWTALELSRQQAGRSEQAARVVFWDAEGQFSLEMLVPALPLVIVEDLIKEAKATIRVR